VKVVMTLAVPDNTGASRMAHAFAAALQQGGHQVVVAHGPVPPVTPDDAAPSIVPTLHAAGVDTALVAALSRPLGPRAVREVRALARAHGADVVIGIQQRDRAVALNAAAAEGRPGVVWLGNKHVFWGNPVVRAGKRFVYRRALSRHADLVVCSSEQTRAEAIHDFGVDAARTALVPNSVDVAGYARLPDVDVAAVRRSLGVRPGTLLLANVARIDRQKGHDVLVQSLASLDRSLLDAITIVVVGGVTYGANNERMRAYERDLTDRVAEQGLGEVIRFVGYRSDVREILSAADAYVHPSRWEGLSLAVLEAMAASLPIVTTEGAGRPVGFVDGTHGYVVPTDDGAALAEAIETMIRHDADRRTAMGDACRSLVHATYEVGVLTSRVVGLVEDVVSRAAAKR
jgi:glycosyltransferase involved in cell wall biosynthesis